MALVLDNNERLMTVHWLVDGVAIGDMVVAPFVTYTTDGGFFLVELVAGICGAMVSLITRYLRWYKSGIRSNDTVIMYLFTTLGLISVMIGTMHDHLSKHPDWAMPYIDGVFIAMVMLVRGVLSLMDKERRQTMIDVEFVMCFDPCDADEESE